MKEHPDTIRLDWLSKQMKDPYGYWPTYDPVDMDDIEWKWFYRESGPFSSLREAIDEGMKNEKE